MFYSSGKYAQVSACFNMCHYLRRGKSDEMEDVPFFATSQRDRSRVADLAAVKSHVIKRLTYTLLMLAYESKATASTREGAVMKYREVAPWVYADENDVRYDLTDLELRGTGAALLHLTAEAPDGITAEICTNGNGEGLWVKVNEVGGYRYDQVAGSLQYQLPKTDRGICDRLRRSIEHVRDPQAAADRRMDEIIAGYEDEWRRERARELS